MAETRSDLALAAALEVVRPVVDLLLREGVDYPRFISGLKATFMEAAEKTLEGEAAKVTDSSVSTLSGVHRKDVRTWRIGGKSLPPSPSLNAVMLLFTRWANDPDYCDAQGNPRILDRAGLSGSFDALAASVSSDVHPRTLLQELLRLGVVQPADPAAGDDRYKLCVDAFVPKSGIEEMLRLFAASTKDHIAAAAHNIAGRGAPMLEQSVFADELRPQSAEELSNLARKIWARAFHEVATEATRLYQSDKGKPDANQRVRFGMYCYKGPMT